MVTRNPANQIEVKPCAKCGWKREVVIYGEAVKVWVQLCSACTADKVADEAEEKVRVSRLRAESIRQKRVSRLEKRHAAWKDRANRYAVETLGLEIFEAEPNNDPYDLKDTAAAAFELGTSAERFVHDSFAEDLASQAHDDLLRQESLDVNDEGDLLDVFTDDDDKKSQVNSSATCSTKRKSTGRSRT